jgi:branched-chain amino acid transport system substrate-binding protein
VARRALRLALAACCVGFAGLLSGQTPPADLIKIGLLIPESGLRRAEGEQLHRGAELALAEANASQARFALVVRADDKLWGAGSREAVELVSGEQVWALLGAVDSASAHVIEQIAMKTRIAFLTPWASDPTLTQIGIPWLFRCVPDDDRQAASLAHWIFIAQHLRRVGTVVAGDRSARIAADAFAKAAAKAGHSIPAGRRWELAADPNRPTPLPASVLQALDRERLEGVVLFGPDTWTASVEDALRQRHAAERVLTPPSQLAIEKKFRDAFRARYGTPPAPAAAFAYDAAWALLRAIDSVAAAGPLDRASIRDALARTNFEGATGTVQFDSKGNRIGADWSEPILH